MQTTAEPPQAPRIRPTPETKRNCRRDYIQGKGSMQAVADKHGVSIDSIKKWAKAENWQEMRAAFDEQALGQAQAPILPPAPPPPPVTPQAARVIRIEKQMEAMEKQMEGCTNAATLRDITAAHSRLFDVWCTLTGTKRPGTEKGSRRSARPVPSAPTEAPVESLPDPIPQVPIPQSPTN